MTVFTDVRDLIADQLEGAALAIGHFGLSAGEAFDTDYGVDLTDIGDGTPMSLSPIGAIVMTQHPDSVGIGWSVPDDWDSGDYWTRYPALAVFAQFLIREEQVGDYGNPAATVNAWLSCGRTEATVLSALAAAARAVRHADRDSKLLAVMA